MTRHRDTQGRFRQATAEESRQTLRDRATFRVERIIWEHFNPDVPFLGNVSPAHNGSGSSSNPAGHRKALETEKEDL